MSNTIGVGLVGYKFMGKAHSNGYRQVAAFFPDVALRPAKSRPEAISIAERQAV